jgi:hypothetical protein
MLLPSVRLQVPKSNLDAILARHGPAVGGKPAITAEGQDVAPNAINGELNARDDLKAKGTGLPAQFRLASVSSDRIGDVLGELASIQLVGRTVKGVEIGVERGQLPKLIEALTSGAREVEATRIRRPLEIALRSVLKDRKANALDVTDKAIDQIARLLGVDRAQVAGLLGVEGLAQTWSKSLDTAARSLRLLKGAREDLFEQRLIARDRAKAARSASVGPRKDASFASVEAHALMENRQRMVETRERIERLKDKRREIYGFSASALNRLGEVRDLVLERGWRSLDLLTIAIARPDMLRREIEKKHEEGAAARAG